MLFASIAKRTGLSSTGMIANHCDDMDDLIREVITDSRTCCSAPWVYGRCFLQVAPHGVV